MYAAGLIAGALAWLATMGEPFATQVPAWQLALGGFLAGYGARLSNGCTAGHGICGIASLQPASMLSVATFLATAMITARLVRAEHEAGFPLPGSRAERSRLRPRARRW